MKLKLDGTELDHKSYPIWLTKMHRSIVSDIRDINAKIEIIAKDSAWDDVLLLSQERHQMITDFFEQIDFENDYQTAKELESEVEKSSERVKKIMVKSRQATVKDGLALQNKQKAINSYRDTIRS